MTDKADNDALVRELEALASKATKGPWSVFYYDAGDKAAWDNCPSIQAPDSEDCAVIHWDGFKQEYWTSANGDQRQIDANAAMICLLRNNLPAILAALRTPQPDETEALRAEVASDGAVFTIRVELEHDVSAVNSTQIHTSVHTKAGANANPVIVMDAAMKALADENAALHQCPAHKAALKGTDHGRG